MFKNTLFISNPHYDFWLKTVLAILLLCFLAPFKIDFNADIPITLQTLMVLWAAIAFGRNIGLIAVAVYILLGLVGVPVFAGHSSGINVLTGPTGGYLFGFLVAAAVIGHLAEQISPRQVFPHFSLWIGGHFLIVLCGLPWQLAVSGDTLSESRNLLILLGRGAMVKSAAGMLFIMLLHRALTPREEFYSKRNI